MIKAYARKDKRTSNGILMCCCCCNRVVPRQVISIDEFNKCSNQNDFIPITDELLSFRPDLRRFV